MLMALYDIRAKIRQQDNTSLAKAREKIAALAAKQQSQMSALERKQHIGSSFHTAQHPYPKKT